MPAIFPSSRRSLRQRYSCDSDIGALRYAGAVAEAAVEQQRVGACLTRRQILNSSSVSGANRESRSCEASAIPWLRAYSRNFSRT